MIRRNVFFIFFILNISVFSMFGQTFHDEIEDPGDRYISLLRYLGDDEYGTAFGEMRDFILDHPGYYRAFKKLLVIGEENGTFEEAVSFLRDLEAWELYNGYAYWALGYGEDLQGNFDEALELYKKAFDGGFCFPELSVDMVNTFFKSHEDKGEAAAAAEAFFLGLLEDWKLEKGPLYLGIGTTALKRFQLDKAKEYLEKAIDADPSISYNYLDLGRVFYYKSDIQKAMDSWKQGLAIAQENKDVEIELFLRDYLGIFYRLSGGDKETALDALFETYDLAAAIDFKPAMSQIIEHVAVIYSMDESYNKAIRYLLESLDLKREIGDEVGESYCLLNLGVGYSVTGEYFKALTYLNEGASLAEKLDNKRLIIACLIQLGSINTTLGLFDEAGENLEKAILISSENGLKTEAYKALNSLGTLRIQEEKFDEALVVFNRAKGYLKDENDVGGIELYRYLGIVYYQMGRYDDAHASLMKSLALLEKTDSSRIHWVLQTLGNIYRLQDNFEQAVSTFEKTLEEADRYDDKNTRLAAVLGLARTYRDMGDNNRSIIYYRDTIAIIESIRSSARLEELKSSYHETYVLVYEECIELLMDLHMEHPEAGYDAEAFYYTESAKARALLDMLEQGDADSIEAAAARPLRLDEVQQNIGDDTVIIEYKQTRSSLFFWKITKEGYRSYYYDIGRETAGELVAQFLDTVGSFLGPEIYQEVAHALFELILEPAWKDIAPGSKLIIIPDGELFYLPFEALVTEWRDGADYNELAYLISKSSVQYAQSASVLGNLSHSGEDLADGYAKELLAFGDPVFNYENEEGDTVYLRSSLSAENISELNRLEYTGLEVSTIGSLFENKDLFLREEAVEEHIKELGSKGRYRYVHFATHGIMNFNNPYYSGLVFSQDDDPGEDGFLQMKEILALDLQADLVVLSACRTGLGKKLIGEGLINLTRAFLFAGADSVAVSLWNVEDKSTADLMIRLYENLKKGFSKSEALREAKRSMIRESGADGFGNPFYWGGFVLVGEE